MGISERDFISQCEIRRKLIFEAVSDPAWTAMPKLIEAAGRHKGSMQCMGSKGILGRFLSEP